MIAHNVKAKIYLMALLIFAPALLQAQKPAASQNKLPTAEQIIEKYIQAIGGIEAMQKIKSYRALGTVEVPAANDSGSIILYAKAPNKSLIVTNLARLGEISEGFNGEKGWGRFPQIGVRSLAPAQQAAVQRNADFSKYQNFKKYFSKVRVLGVEKVSDSSTYVIEATPIGGGSEKMYFETESGLLIRLDAIRAATKTKGLTSIAYLKDYRTINGIKMPFYLQQTIGGVILVMKLLDVKTNVAIDDSIFEPPIK